MVSKTERTVINAAGLVQGIVLVTFPAASTIFTEKSQYGLSSSQYGDMFLPQVVLAIAMSLLGRGLARRISTKRVYLIGLTCSIVSMVLLLASTLVKSNQSAAYPLLLVATAFLGAGFGLTVPVLNTYTSVFNPDSVDRAVLTLNALLGLGTVLAPVLVAVFVGLGFWWGLPVASTVLLVGLLVVSLRLPLRAGTPASGAARRARPGFAARFWWYAAFATAYGICETMNGNWSQLDMTTRLGASATQASLALAAFWAMVTVGRVLFGAIGRWLPERVTYRILPFVLVGTFILIGVLSLAARNRGNRRLRAGRPGTLGPAAADDQLRPGGSDGDLRRDGGVRDRFLPAWLRDRRVRRRPAARRWHKPVGDLRFHCMHCHGDGRPGSFFVAHRRPWAAGPAGAGSGSPPAASTIGPLRSNPQ